MALYMNNNSFWFEKRTIVALSLSMLALAEIVDLTIVSVALPHLMGALEANINQISLTLTSYIVASAIFIPLTGFATKKYGFKKVALISAVIFGISSVLCGMSTSLVEMVVFRILQGVGGAFLPALAQGYIVENFDTQEQPKVMLVFSLCVVMGPIIGPLFGGYIVEHLTWRWIFYVNVPICLIGIVLITLLMKESKLENIKTDYISFSFMAIGIGCLEYFLDEGNQNSWLQSKEMVIILVTGIIATGFFIWRGLIGKSVVNFKIFKSMTFNLSCFLVFAFMVMAVLSLAYFPTLLQQGYGYPVDLAGYITSPRGIFALIAAPIFINLAKKKDPRKILFLGLLIYTLSCVTMIWYGASASTPLILLTLSLQGIGLTATFVILIQLAFIELPNQLSNDAAGIFNFFRNIGNSVGTSIAATIISRQQQISWHDMGSKITQYNHNVYNFVTALNGNTLNIKAQLIASEIQLQAFLIANLDTFYVSLIGMLCILWVPFFLKKPDPNVQTTVTIH
jgi:DHA2 family multidrug resistance protein